MVGARWKGEFYYRKGKTLGSRPSWRNPRTGEVKVNPITAPKKAIWSSRRIGYEPTGMHTYGAHITRRTPVTEKEQRKFAQRNINI